MKYFLNDNECDTHDCWHVIRHTLDKGCSCTLLVLLDFQCHLITFFLGKPPGGSLSIFSAHSFHSSRIHAFFESVEVVEESPQKGAGCEGKSQGHQDNMSVCFISPCTQLLYSNNGFTGVSYMLSDEL